MDRQKLKQRLIRFGTTYILAIVALTIFICAISKTTHELDADATITDLTVTATLPAKAQRMVSVGSLLDIRIEPEGETPYSLRLPVDSVCVAGPVLTAVAHLDSAEIAGLTLPDSLQVVINTPSMTIFQYWFGN